MQVSIDDLSALGGRFIGVAAIILVCLLLYLATRRFLAFLAGRQYISEPLYTVTRNLLRWSVVILAALFALQQFGVKISSIISSLLTITAMIAIGFIAVWSVFSNFLCSFLLLVFSPFRIGDQVEILEPVGGEGLRGQVVDFNIMYTTLLETAAEAGEDPAVIRIPNNVFFQKAVKRWKGTERKSIEKHLLDKSLAAGIGRGRAEKPD